MMMPDSDASCFKTENNDWILDMQICVGTQNKRSNSGLFSKAPVVIDDIRNEVSTVIDINNNNLFHNEPLNKLEIN